MKGLFSQACRANSVMFLQAVQESIAATVVNGTLQLESVGNLTTSYPVKLAVSLMTFMTELVVLRGFCLR